MKASIIIRTKNESKLIGSALEMLFHQNEKDFEVLIVDSGSTDRTIQFAESYKAKLDLKIFKIKPEEFTYPFACNYGAENSNGKYLVYLSGHSIPIGENWLESGLENFEKDNVAGVYGPVFAGPSASICEKLFYGIGKLSKSKKKVIKKATMGVLGNTNAIIKKDLWEKYHFDEQNFSDGGEDGDWAKHFLNEGYEIILDPNFAVRHSHGLGLGAFLKQYLHWEKVAKKFS